MAYIGRYRRYLTFGIVLCVLAVGVGNWFGSTMRTKAPPGYEPTAIPGVFVKDRVADFGMISPNRLVEAAFDLFNASKKAYVVKQVSADCGCATVNLTDRTLRPNESLVVPLTVDASKLKGNAFRKGVLVELARLGQEQTYKDVFRLTGMMDRSGTFVVWPGILDYGDMVPGASAHKTIYFKADQALLKVLPPGMEVDQPSEIVNLPKVEYAGTLGVKPVEVRLVINKEARPGKFESSVNVEVAGSPPRRMVIPVRALVVDNVKINPERIYMAVSNDGEQDRADLTLRSVTDSAVAVKEVTSSLPLQFLISREPDSAKTVTVTVTLDEGTHLGGLLLGNIEIRMSDDTRHLVPVVLVPANAGDQGRMDVGDGKISETQDM